MVNGQLSFVNEGTFHFLMRGFKKCSTANDK